MKEEALAKFDSAMNMVIRNENLLFILKDFCLNNPDSNIGMVLDIIDILQDGQKECKELLDGLGMILNKELNNN